MRPSLLCLVLIASALQLHAGAAPTPTSATNASTPLRYSPATFLDPSIAETGSADASSFEGYLLTVFWPPTALPPASHADAKFSILKSYASPSFWTLAFTPFSPSAPLPTAVDAASSLLPAGCDPSTVPALSSASDFASRVPGWNLSLSFYASTRADHQRLGPDVPFWEWMWNPPGEGGTPGGGGGGCSGLDPLRYFLALFAASANSRTLVESSVTSGIFLQDPGPLSSLGVVPNASSVASAFDSPSFRPSSEANAPPVVVDVATVAASLGEALVPGSMLCVVPSPQKEQQRRQMRLAQMTVCVDRGTLSPTACPPAWRAEAERLKGALSSPPASSPPPPVGGALPTVASDAAVARGLSIAPGQVLASCLDDFVSAAADPSSSSARPLPPPSNASLPLFTAASAKRIIPGLIRSQDPVTFKPLSVWWWTPAFLGLLLLCLGALAAAAFAASRAGLVPALFAPRGDSVRVARNPNVREPVVVRCERFDVSWAASVAPALATVVADLPVGVGLKGGVARKLLKHRFGARPEPPGSFDVDVAVLLPDALAASPAAARSAKESLVGTRLGDLTLEAQDCEVDAIGDFVEYFCSRDVTLNEVLLLRVSEASVDEGRDGGVLLFYTELAARDAAADVVRPSVHARAAPYSFVWDVDSRGRAYVAARPVARAVIRRLKGHGSSYAFDEGTLAHWRRVGGLPPSACFQILRPFHRDDAKYRKALDHLIEMGFVRRRDVVAAGGRDAFWGSLLKSINAGAARAGGRLTLAELDVSAVETWAERKKASVGAGIVARAAAAPRTGWVASDESAMELGLVECDDATKGFLANPSTFDAAAFARSRGKPDVAAAAEAAAADVVAGRSGGGGEGGGEEAPAGLADLVKRCAAAASSSSKWADPGGGGALDDDGGGSGGVGGEGVVGDAAAAAAAVAASTKGGATSPSPPSEDAPQTLLLRTSLAPLPPATPTQCFGFALGVALLSRWHGVAALALSLVSLAAQLYVPRAFGRAFTAVVDLDAASFPQAFAVLGVATLAAAALQFAAAVALQDYGAAVTRRAFWRLFANLLRGGGGNEADGEQREPLALGEILARMSGDALALRSVVVSSAPAALQGTLLSAGAAACVLWKGASFASGAGRPGILVAAVVALALVFVEGAALSRLAWRCSRRARSLLGRLFALTLAALSSSRTLSSLGLEGPASREYKSLSRDFYDATFAADAVAVAHAAAVALIGAGLRVAVLWLGGEASVGATAAGATTVAAGGGGGGKVRGTVAAGDIFETLLYAKWLQLGLSTAGKGLAACVEGGPSVARVLELQRRQRRGGGDGGDKTAGGALDGDLEPSSVSGGDARAEAAAVAAAKRKLKREKPRDEEEGDGEKRQGDDEDDDDSLSPSISPPPKTPEEARALAEAMTGAVALRLRRRDGSPSSSPLPSDVVATPGKVTLLVSSSPSVRRDAVDALLLRRPPPPGGSLLLGVGRTGGGQERWARPPRLVSDSSSPRPISSLDPPVLSSLVEPPRSRCALLSPATAHAFSGASVEDNVAAAADRATTSAEVSAAVEAAGLREWAASLPDGLRTRVGPKTTGPLSRSVATRVALARCLVRSPALLVVEEPEALVAVAATDVARALSAPPSSRAVVLVAASGAAAEAVSELADVVVDLDS